MFDSDEETNESKSKINEYQEIFPRRPKPYLKSFDELKRIRKISQGSFGIVYQYFNPNKNEFYAVKQMKWSNRKSIINQIKRQIDLLYKINSPNLVKLYDHFAKKEEIYLIMEFVDGNNLYDEILKPRKQLSYEIISNVIVDICDGLIQLHKNKIVHRDLKLQNIMMSSKGQIKIIDLGESNFYGEGIQRKTTRGTKTYFSPQITNKEGQDDRIDVWCLGVIIYEIVCLQSPFRGITQDELYENIRRFKYPIPQKIKNDKLLLNLFSKIFTWHAERIDIQKVKNHPWIKKNLNKDLNEPPKFERLFGQKQIEQYRNYLIGRVQKYKNEIKALKEQNKQIEKMVESSKQKKIQFFGKDK